MEHLNKTFCGAVIFVLAFGVGVAGADDIVGDIAEPFGRVDVEDVIVWAGWWLAVDCGEPDHCGEADMSGPDGEADGVVDLYDFSVLSSHWLEGVLAGDIAEPYGLVDEADLMLMVEWWMVSLCDSFFNGCFGADMSGPEGVADGTVNLHDFAVLAGNWLASTETQP